MARLGFTVAGEAHGAGLVGILTGLPRGIPLQLPELQSLLTRRRTFAGRGSRSSFETCDVQWLAGVEAERFTNGGPVAFLIPNQDSKGQHSTPEGTHTTLEYPRPGHADAAGAARWHLKDATPVAELASGRITAAYCVAGHLCHSLLATCWKVQTLAHVTQLGGVRLPARRWQPGSNLASFRDRAWNSPYLVLDPRCHPALEQLLAQATQAGDTLGGKVEIVAAPLPSGLGAVQPLEQRLDARLAGLLMGLPGVKAVEIGDVTGPAARQGSTFHDAFLGNGGRATNHAGGLEGGMTNGQPLVVRLWIKPVPTLHKPLPSVSLVDGTPGFARVVRSDVTAVAPTALAAEALVRLALAEALLDDASGRTLDEIRR